MFFFSSRCGCFSLSLFVLFLFVVVVVVLFISLISFGVQPSLFLSLSLYWFDKFDLLLAIVLFYMLLKNRNVRGWGRERGRAREKSERTHMHWMHYILVSLFLAYKQATAAVVNHRRGGTTTTTTTNITLSFTFYSIMLIRFARIFQSECFVRACSESSASTNQNTQLILSLSFASLAHQLNNKSMFHLFWRYLSA